MTKQSASPDQARQLGRDVYSLAMEATGVDGELAVAFAMISSEDPEEQQRGEELVQELLAIAANSSEALTEKASAICSIIESMRARAAFLKESAQARIAKAKGEEAAADKLLARVSAALHTVHPTQTRFQLPEYDLRSRSAERVIVDPDRIGEIPDRFCKLEVNIKIASCPDEPTNHQYFLDSLTDHISEFGGNCEVKFSKTPDLTCIKQVIKAGTEVPGCVIRKERHWRLD